MTKLSEMQVVRLDDTASSEPHGLMLDCPWCAYSLRGLPDEHRCPECGQPVDRKWIVFGGAVDSARRNKWRWPIAVLLVFLVGYMLFVNVHAWFYSGGISLLGLFWIGLFSSLTAGYLKKLGSKHIAIVAPQGLRFFHGKSEQLAIAWSEILYVRFDVARWNLAVELANGRQRDIPFKSYFGGFMPDVDRFVSVANHERKAYYARLGQTPPQPECDSDCKPGQLAPLRFPIA